MASTTKCGIPRPTASSRCASCCQNPKPQSLLAATTHLLLMWPADTNHGHIKAPWVLTCSAASGESVNRWQILDVCPPDTCQLLPSLPSPHCSVFGTHRKGKSTLESQNSELLQKNYGMGNRSVGKAANKRALQRELGLPEKDVRPFAVTLSRSGAFGRLRPP